MENTVPPATDGFPLILLPNVLMFIFFFFERLVTVSKETSGLQKKHRVLQKKRRMLQKKRRLFKRAVVDVSKSIYKHKGLKRCYQHSNPL